MPVSTLRPAAVNVPALSVVTLAGDIKIPLDIVYVRLDGQYLGSPLRKQADS